MAPRARERWVSAARTAAPVRVLIREEVDPGPTLVAPMEWGNRYLADDGGGRFAAPDAAWQGLCLHAPALLAARKDSMGQHLAERLRFLRAFLAHPRQVGAVLPTSRFAVRDMLDMADVAGADLVLELGAGTGVSTGEILTRLGPDARVVAFEIDPRLARILEERFPDPRLQVVCDSAERVLEHLGSERADVLVCALPFTSLDPGLRRRLLDVLPQALAKTGTAVVIQYSPLILGELRRRFPSVRRRLSPRNVPPAFLFACSLQEDSVPADAEGPTAD